MQLDQLVTLILSPLTASALVALLRRHIPQIDGPYIVPGVVVALAVIGNLLPVLASGAITSAAITGAIVSGIVGGTIRAIDQDKCKACLSCLKLGCPAIEWQSSAVPDLTPSHIAAGKYSAIQETRG